MNTTIGRRLANVSRGAQGETPGGVAEIEAAHIDGVGFRPALAKEQAAVIAFVKQHWQTKGLDLTKLVGAALARGAAQGYVDYLSSVLPPLDALKDRRSVQLANQALGREVFQELDLPKQDAPPLAATVIRSIMSKLGAGATAEPKSYDEAKKRTLRQPTYADAPQVYRGRPPHFTLGATNAGGFAKFLTCRATLDQEQWGQTPLQTLVAAIIWQGTSLGTEAAAAELSRIVAVRKQAMKQAMKQHGADPRLLD